MSSKTRKALSEAGIALSWATHGHLTEEDAKGCLAVVDAALAEPLRNCEVGSYEEQFGRWEKLCESNGGQCFKCKFDTSCDLSAKCFAKWSQMAYESEVK